MTALVIEPGQQRVARIVGLLYVLQMATAIFAETFVRGRLVVADAAQTARNIEASERLFRFSIVTDLLTYAMVVGLTAGIYVLLRATARDAALVGLALRLVENGVTVVVTLCAFAALRLLGDAPYLSAIETAQRQSLARLCLGLYGNGLQIAFVFTGFGSAMLAWAWWRSGYIPRGFAAWGVFASLLLALGGLVIIVWPVVYQRIGMSYMAPMFVWEVGLGLLLMIRGLRQPAAAAAS